jgi:hypothetical protein
MTKVSDLFPSKYLKASDAEEPITLTMTVVAWEPMKDKDGKDEDKPVLYFKEVEKGMVLNVTNAKVIQNLYGDEVENWSGKTILLHAMDVTAFGETKPALRVSTKKPIAGKVSAPASAADINDFWKKVYSLKLSTEQGDAVLAESNGDFKLALASLQQPA